MKNKGKKQKQIRLRDKPSIPFRIGQVFVKLFTTKFKFQFEEEMKTDGIRIICTNHAQISGPLSYQLYYPYKKKIWCISDVFTKSTFPAYAMKDFWPDKKDSKFFKIISKCLGPLAEFVFRNADVLPVYKDQRFFSTAKMTVNCLENGYDLVLMPECRENYNYIVNEYQENFVSIAKLYYQKNKKRVYFYPSYVAPKLKKVVIGKPIEYNPNNDFEVEKKRICAYLKEATTAIAYSLPDHEVIPYANKLKEYKWKYEKTGNARFDAFQKRMVKADKAKLRTKNY